jgi:hypothetical protein
MRKFTGISVFLALCLGAFYAQGKKEKSLALENRPTAAQQTIQSVVEEETTIDSIPAAAKAAILTKVGSGKLGMV